jgi:hypothetical protein
MRNSHLRGIMFCVSVSALLAMALGSMCLGAGPTKVPGSVSGFSADWVQTFRDKTQEFRMYLSGDTSKGKLRIEMPDKHAVNIMRFDKGVRWSLNTGDQTFRESSQLPAAINWEKAAKSDPNTKFLGKETISGFVCDKYYHKGAMPKFGGMAKQVAWYSKDLKFEIKTQVYSAKDVLLQTEELKNIKKGAQPASLFEVPSGYKLKEKPLRLRAE